MKLLSITSLFLILFLSTGYPLSSDESEDKEMMNKIDSVYEFKHVINVETTKVKNQNRTGTCWTFAGNSFIETELLREGKGEVDLSEMFIVRNMYPEKADLYVRYHGKTQFGEGALTNDVMRSIDKYGVVPESEYSTRPENGYLNHAEMSGILEDMLKRIVATDASNRTTKWKKAFESVLDVYMGPAPSKFEVNGVEYTPISYRDYLGIDTKQFVDITSFTHHPFYNKFVLEVPDNFSHGEFYNVPMNELLEITEKALENGYSVDWGADVSEPSFESKYGLAINPADMKQMILDKDVIKWDSIYTELNITQEIRQEDFDNYLTQDDHGMHIVGIVKDKLNRKYFVVKNSWGTKKRGHEGYLYVSYSYFMHKTTAITLNKNGIPSNLKKKLKIN
jgi:bleomycin hydrolase